MASGRAAAAVLMLVAGALSGAASGATKLYKWVDENGNVTYSQTKPPEPRRQVEEIELRGYRAAEPGRAGERLEQQREEGAAQRQDQDLAAGEAAARKAREERMRKNCEIARNNLRILRNAPRIRDKDAEGQPYFLSPEQIEQRIEQTQRQIEDYCG